MSVRDIIARVFSDGGHDVVVECRQCGTTVDRGVEVCPACGRTGFSRYDISG